MLSFSFTKTPSKKFDMALNTPLNYKESIGYYNADTLRTFQFLCQKSKESTKVLSTNSSKGQITNSSFKGRFPSPILLIPFKHLGSKTLQLL